MIEKGLGYQILDECKNGPEEFSVLISSVNFANTTELNKFLEVTVNLVKEGLLICSQGKRRDFYITNDEMKSYVNMRIDAGEKLDEYPSIIPELTFFTTEKGISCLKEEDRPLAADKGYSG
jgi:hypothetical protein